MEFESLKWLGESLSCKPMARRWTLSKGALSFFLKDQVHCMSILKMSVISRDPLFDAINAYHYQLHDMTCKYIVFLWNKCVLK